MVSSTIMIYIMSFLAVVSGAETIKCFKCSMVPLYIVNETIRLCSHFDFSDKYVVDCKHSTMCMKKSFEWITPSGEIVHGVERDCASQKDEQQVYENNKWIQRTLVKEVYEEGCRTVDDKGARTLPTGYCYCRKPLCNSASSNDQELSYHVDAMAVIFVFNAIRYFRSMELG